MRPAAVPSATTERPDSSGRRRAAGPPRSRIARVSVVIPMLNEEAHVEQLAQELAHQDFAGELEVIVSDGGSDDRSVARLRDAARRFGLDLTILENPGIWTSGSLNRCVERATGDLVVRLDCHSSYPPDYVRACANAAAETGAWNVGGKVVAEGETRTERAVACAMASAFGGIGWTRYDDAGARVEVDTVTFGAFPAETFKRVGLFDESLLRGQDDEFSLRIRRAGGRVVLDPSIEVRYRPRSSLRGVLRQYHGYGRWKVPVMLKHRRVLSARSLAPAAFVVSIPTLAVAAVWWSPAGPLLAAELVAYVTLAAVVAGLSIKARGESWRLLPATTATFPAFHVGYGAGMVSGLFRAGFGRIRQLVRQRAAR